MLPIDKARPKALPRGDTGSRRRGSSPGLGAARAAGRLSAAAAPARGRKGRGKGDGSYNRSRSEEVRSQPEHHWKEEGRSKTPPSEKIVACFKEFDINGDGRISLDELMTVMRKINKSKTLTESEVKGVLDEIDCKDDGTIDIEEFGDWIKKAEGDSDFSHDLFENAVTAISRETPEERLKRCLNELRAGEEAALPPKLLAVDLEQSDDTKMFDSADDGARKYKQLNRVVRCHHTSAAYKAGVRIGWYVLEVGDLTVTEAMDLPKLIKPRLGGGGGEQRGCRVGFVSPKVLQAQHDAIAALPALLEAANAARAALEKSLLQPPPIVEEVVTIKYYQNKVSFPLAPDGRLLTSVIDDVLGLSEAMPGCELHLAQELEGDEHLVPAGRMETVGFLLVPRCQTVFFEAGDPGIVVDAATGCVSQVLDRFQAARKGVKAGWYVQSVDGQKYKAGALEERLEACIDCEVVFRDKDGFSGLVLGSTYFLIVEMSTSVSPAEVKWRARMKKEHEFDRLAALPKHSCAKMQVPLQLHALTNHGEFLVDIDNSEGHPLGVNWVLDSDEAALIIDEVLFWGLIGRFNALYPVKALRAGDCIAAVNGVRGGRAVLLEELKRKRVLFISVYRVDYFVGDRVHALFRGTFFEACIERDNRNGTFDVMWTDKITREGMEGDRIKTPMEMKKHKETTELRHTQVNGDFWFNGSKSQRPQYINDDNTLLYFNAGHWQLGSEDSFRCYYSLPNATALLAPTGDWPSPLNPGCVATVHRAGSGATGCLICTESMDRDTE